MEKEGLVFIDNIEQARKNIIIRAHGEPQETYIKAKKLNLNMLDLTCPKVKKIHEIANQYAQNGYYILLIGQKNHPETIGTISYCGNYKYVIQEEQEIDNAIIDINNSKIQKLLIISQTTFSLDKFENISNKIKEKLNKDIIIEIKNTICSATKTRQEETKKIAKEVDYMIIIGGKHSSNTNKLYKIATMYCKNTILIENEKELDIKTINKNAKIGIMAGASTPQKSIDLVIELLNAI